ncbi:MAG TPA: hypothetical protein VIQ31_24815 [Phormidium sp.]
MATLLGLTALFARLLLKRPNQVSVAGNSNAKVVYNALSGDLFYNQNGGAAGLGTGGLFATLSSKPSLVVNDLFVQA